ncbi:conjugal transfer protein TrbL, partial [Escherichia coli]|nr:conjugal transfer protein TrbL [Escherichia coli]
VIGVLIAVFVWKSSSFAQQLAGAGVEGTLQGMALLGIGAAGMAVEKTRNQMKRGTRTAAEWAGEKGEQKRASIGALGMEARRRASLEKARARNSA